ncbi:MAG: dihydropteroate synthase [Desulfobacteraceae bacterium]|nr:MAG: dihydropteroate synthase [Desulfobacteraceae bacterium]
MLIIADNLHVLHPTIARAVELLDPAPIMDLVRRCAAAGAQAIDINCGPLKKDPQHHMTFLVETVQAAADLPLMLDTTNAAAMAAGLAAARRRPIINGFSLEPVKLARMLPLAQAHQADIVGYLLHPDSRVPLEEEEMMGLALNLFEVYCKAGMDPARLIIDPVIMPLGWADGARHNRSVLTVVRNLPDLLGTPVRTMAGLSNLASGPMPLARKIALEQAFLPMLAAAGLTFALANVLHAPAMETARLSKLLLDDFVFTG